MPDRGGEAESSLANVFGGKSDSTAATNSLPESQRFAVGEDQLYVVLGAAMVASPLGLNRIGVLSCLK